MVFELFLKDAEKIALVPPQYIVANTNMPLPPFGAKGQAQKKTESSSRARTNQRG
jgi:hypothetical protein